MLRSMLRSMFRSCVCPAIGSPAADSTPTTADINAFGWGVFLSMAEGDSDLFTDLGLTAANVGDPVRQINDLSGNARNAIAPGAAQRPVLQADRSLLLDGVDDRLAFTNTGSALGFTVAATFKAVTIPGQSMILCNALGNPQCRLYNTPYRQTFYGNGLGHEPTVSLGGSLTDKLTLITTMSAAGVAKLYKNGVYLGTFSGTAITGWIWNQISWSSSGLNGYLYNVGIKPDGVLTDEQILQYAQWAGTA